jgi:hypothetical protein
MPAPEHRDFALCGDTYHAINSCAECQRIWHRAAARKKAVKMPTKSVGPQCPECGDTASRSLQRGWSEPNDNFLRRRECKNCGVRFVTAEVVVPTDETTFYRLDYRGREWRRENWRSKYAKSGRRLPVQRSDQLQITVKVKPNPELERNICLRGHAFTPENTYVYPNGNRTCIKCRVARQRRYYAERRAA